VTGRCAITSTNARERPIAIAAGSGIQLLAARSRTSRADRQDDSLNALHKGWIVARGYAVVLSVRLAAIDPFQILLHERIEGVGSLSAKHSKKSNSAWHAMFACSPIRARIRWACNPIRFGALGHPSLLPPWSQLYRSRVSTFGNDLRQSPRSHL
jgi:hypothetical protein